MAVVMFAPVRGVAQRGRSRRFTDRRVECRVRVPGQRRRRRCRFDGEVDGVGQVRDRDAGLASMSSSGDRTQATATLPPTLASERSPAVLQVKHGALELGEF